MTTDPNATGRTTRQDKTTLATSLEQRTCDVIRSIWAKVLGVEEDTIGDHDDFFSKLAGSSLQVLTIMEKIQAIAGEEELPEEIFFGEQTIARQARILIGSGRRVG